MTLILLKENTGFFLYSVIFVNLPLQSLNVNEFNSMLNCKLSFFVDLILTQLMKQICCQRPWQTNQNIFGKFKSASRRWNHFWNGFHNTACGLIH